MRRKFRVLAALLPLVVWGASPDWSNGFNVKDFGAKGDGVTDDTAAIQKVLDTIIELRASNMPSGIPADMAQRHVGKMPGFSLKTAVFATFCDMKHECPKPIIFR